MNVTTAGIDLAKSVFQVHGADARSKPLLRRQLRRDQVAEFFANLPPCLVGMDACSGAHHWARKLESLGHTVRLMPPQFVRPYVNSCSLRLALKKRAQSGPPFARGTSAALTAAPTVAC